MTKQEKQTFIGDLIAHVHTDILDKLDKIPENWDGVEIRAYIADCFAELQFHGILIGKRKKEYKNDVIVNNL